MAKIRLQIQLDRGQYQCVKREASRRGISVSETIRKSVDFFLSQTRSYSEEDVGRLASFLGAYSDPKTDVSVKHHDYAYGARK